MLLNLKIQQLINTVNDACAQAINDGVPVYAAILALKDIETNGLMPLANQAVQKEYAELQKEQAVAKPIGDQFTKPLESEEM